MVDKGEIYKITCCVSNKCYIGQALKFVSGRCKWGARGRFKSHLNGALSGNSHCEALNNAILKYGVKNFSYEILHDDVPIDNMDRLEIECIAKYNTQIPNGYNISQGGSGKLGNEVKAQIKNRGTIIYRRQEIDKDLPLFMTAKRRFGYIIGYVVNMPLPNGECKFKEFKRKNINESYKAAVELIEKSKIEYKYDEWKDKVVVKLIKNLTENEKNVKCISTKSKRLINRLPEYIYPVMEKNRCIGFCVDKFLNNNGIPYPKKEFTELSCNGRNLGAAERYLNHLNVIKKNELFVEYIPDDLKNIGSQEIRKRSNATKNLPKYIAFIIVNGVKIGYQINNFPLGKKQIKKKYCDTKITLEDNYKLALDYLRDLVNKKNALNQPK